MYQLCSEADSLVVWNGLLMCFGGFLICFLMYATSKRFPRDFLDGTVVKNLPSIAGDAGSISGSGTKTPHDLR